MNSAKFKDSQSPKDLRVIAEEASLRSSSDIASRRALKMEEMPIHEEISSEESPSPRRKPLSESSPLPSLRNRED